MGVQTYGQTLIKENGKELIVVLNLLSNNVTVRSPLTPQQWALGAGDE